MFVTQSLNELAKLALIASDDSYFTGALNAPSALAPLRDTPNYDILPLYTIMPGFNKVSNDNNSRIDSIGFKFVAYRNEATNEVIVAFGGSDGPDPVDWTSNTALGWNQWEDGRDRVFELLRDSRVVNASTKVHFTGQSLGGALAQYAAYEWVKTKSTVTDEDDPEFLANFEKSNVSLTTFNGLGGLKGLVDNLPTSGVQHASYDPTILQGLGLSGHFYITNDLVSRFGGGHVGGDTFLLDFRSDRTNDFGHQYAYGLVDAHRIETGFYANLRPGALLEFQVSPGTSPIAYLNVDSMQEYAALFGNLLNNKNFGLTESRFRLVGAVTAGLTIGSPSDVNTLTRAVITSLHDSGDLSDSWFQKFSGVNWGAIFIPTRPVTGAISILSTLGAVFADAVQGAAGGISTIFQSMSEYISAGSRPDVTVTPPSQIDVSSRQLQFEVLMASMGAAPHLTELMASLPFGLDPEALAAQMLTGGAEWLPNILAFARTHANIAGQPPSQLAEMMTQLVTALNHRVDELQDMTPQEKGQLVAQLNAFTQDTASGFANALPDFTQKIADVVFNLSKTISDFADIQLIDQAYAGELNDPRLSSSARAAIEGARETFQQAAQTVVIEKGVGPNPFHTPGFVPGEASTATVDERLGEQFRLSLPFAAGTGGQRVSLQLQGPQANHLSVSAGNDVQDLGANGTFELTVSEGDDQLYFSLIADNEVTGDATVILSATLVGADDQPTHTPQVESVVTVKAFVGNTDPRYVTYEENWEWVTDGAGLVLGVGGFSAGSTAEGAIYVQGYNQILRGGNGPDVMFLPKFAYGDDTIYGNGGDDYLTAGRGHDVIYGGDGNDQLLGDMFLDGSPELPWDLPVPDARGIREGKDYVDGGAGNDLVEGGGNDDRLIGGADDDVLWGDTITTSRLSEGDHGFEIFYLTGVLHPGNDVLEGGEGNDALSGDGGDDTLDGGPGDDFLVGDKVIDLDLPIPMAPGDDFLTGGTGDDQLYGNAGNDVLLGGEGNDVLSGDDEGAVVFEEGDDWLEGGEGLDQLFGRGGNDTLIGDGGADVLFGGTGNDALDGGEGDDVGFGGAGDDTIIGGEGLDQFDGEAGNDVLFGDDGNDLLIGGDGLDELDGGGGDDLLGGGADADTIFAGEGNDELQGGLGNDLLVGGAGDDRVFGEAGDDQLFGDDGHDVLRGDDGNDELDGGAGDDILVGDADGQIGGVGGNDTLAGGAGNDTLVGGGGQDTYFFGIGNGFDVITEAAGEGNRLVFGTGISSDAIIAAAGPDDSFVIRTGNGESGVQISNFGIDDLAGSHPIDSFEFSDGTILTYSQLAAAGLAVSGGLGNDRLIGTAQGERIFGGEGNDTVTAGAGNDVLLGGIGNDVLFGEAGLDTYIFASGGGIDRIEDTAGEGNRIVFASGISQANISLGFKQIIIPDGSEEDPGTVVGYLVLRTGGAGEAVEIGGFDPTNQFAPLAIEQFTFADGTILTSAQLLARGLELVGTAGFDTLDGQEIYRTIRGFGGNDTLIGGSIDNVVEGGDGDDVLRGGDGNDALDGGAGNDSLEGEAGDDVLVGGAGDDQLYGGEGSDTYRVNLGEGLDSIFDSGSSTDTDTVIFGSGITSGALTLTADSGQILLKVGTGSDSIYIGSTFDVFGSQTIEQFQLTDGAPISYADLIAQGFDIDGTSADDFILGTNVVDRFYGGLGNDRLEGSAGNDFYFFNIGDGVDTIVDTATIGAGNEVVFGPGITSTDLRLDVASDQSDPSRSVLVLHIGTDGDALQLDTFDRTDVFGSGTVASFRFADGSTLTYEQLLVRGFDLTGTAGDDRIIGTNVVDRIVGGTGVDVLRGGPGDDAYLFGRGSGQDTIVERQGSEDAIRFAAGVVPSDVIVMRENNDLVLKLNGGADRLTVSQYFVASSLQIELVQFADGTVWDQTFLDNLVQLTTGGTARADILVGTSGDDRLLALSGNDQLIGLVGNDQLDGGTGADQLIGGSGDDMYIVDDMGDVVTELVNEGVDTVRSSVTRTLEANVENLVLTGTEAINGTGNELENILTGNSAANVLTGGLGAG